MKLEDITIIADGIDWNKCLQHWNWLLQKCPEFSIYLVTKFAELLVIDNSEAIWFLSTSGASFEKVADNELEFFELCENQEEFDFFFMPQVIEQLTLSGIELKQGECFGFITPSVFAECTFAPSNFKAISVENYLIALGDMIGKIKDTQNGQKVTYQVVP